MGGKNRKPYPIPPPELKVRNLASAPVIESNGYTVAEWHKEPDGAGKPTAVVLLHHVVISDLPFDVGMAITSRQEMDRLITILGSHAQNVWPVAAS